MRNHRHFLDGARYMDHELAQLLVETAAALLVHQLEGRLEVAALARAQEQLVFQVHHSLLHLARLLSD